MQKYIAIIAFTLLMGCTSRQQSSTDSVDIVIAVDITGGKPALPSPEDVTRVYDLDENPTRGARFRLIELSDILYERVQEYTLSSTTQLMSNPSERTEAIKTFTDHISMALSLEMASTRGRDKSEIWTPLVKELNALSLKKSDVKIMYAYSDLAQNTALFSVYDSLDARKLVDSPEAVKALLKSQADLKDMTGVQLHLIYSAKSNRESERHARMASLIKEMVEEKHGTVVISGSFIE